MGTRNLTAVFMDGEYKVAQYGQWDGYQKDRVRLALFSSVMKWMKTNSESS